jgi:hypothetical protein
MSRTAKGDADYLELLVAKKVPIETRSEDVLITEVVKLRAELAEEKRMWRAGRQDAVEQWNNLNDEADDMRAKLARVEALPAFWRALDVSSCEKLNDEGRWRLDRCADDLEGALKQS